MNIKIQNPFRNKNTFEGVFSLPQSGHYYSKSSIKEEIKGIHISFGQEFYIILSSIVSTFPKDEITILDVGGGMGTALSYLDAPKKKINLFIQEIPELVEAGRKLKIKAKFISNFKGQADIVIFGSSFQYLDSFLSKIPKINPSMIIFGYTPLIPHSPTFYSIQVNMKGRKIPVMIASKTEIEEELKMMGYKLIFETVQKTEAHFRNFQYPQSESKFYHLIFKKILKVGIEKEEVLA